MTEPTMDPRGRRLLVSQAPLDQIPVAAFFPALSAVLGPGTGAAQWISPDAATHAAIVAARLIAVPRRDPAGGRWCWTASEVTARTADLVAMGTALGNTPALYFSVRWGTLGALRASPALLLPHAVTLAEQGLGCLVTSLDGDEGLRLDLLSGDTGAQTNGTFELIVWGARWLRAALEALERAPIR